MHSSHNSSTRHSGSQRPGSQRFGHPGILRYPYLHSLLTTSDSRCYESDPKDHERMGAKVEERLHHEALEISIQHTSDDEIADIIERLKGQSDFDQCFGELDDFKSEENCATHWTMCLDIVSQECSKNPRLHFGSIGDNHIKSSCKYTPTNFWGKPDLAIYTVKEKEKGPPSWQECHFLGEFKLKEDQLDNIKTRGQLFRYLRNLLEHQPKIAITYGLILAGRNARLYQYDMAGCKSSGIINIHDICSVVKLVLFLHELVENPRCLRWNNSEIYINQNFSDPMACTDTQIQLEGTPQKIFYSCPLFGRRTYVECGFQFGQEVILKRSYIEEAFISSESIIHQKLTKCKIPGIPPFLKAGVAGLHANSLPSTLEYDQPTHRKVYDVVLMTEANPATFVIARLPGLKDIILTLRDATRIVWLAWTKCSILHRDISVGNVLGIPISSIPEDEQFKIYNECNLDNATGHFLAQVIDWGNASDYDNKQLVKLPDGQSGTLPFTSYRMHEAFEEQAQPPSSTTNIPPVHLPLDDLESIVYLLLWSIEQHLTTPQQKQNTKGYPETTCWHYLSDHTRKAALGHNASALPRQFHPTNELVVELSEAWDVPHPIKGKLVEICYYAIRTIALHGDIEFFLSENTHLTDDPGDSAKCEAFKVKVTQFSRNHFQNLVTHLTKAAKELENIIKNNHPC